MANKITHSNDQNLYGSGNYDPGASSPHKMNWTEGLPHDFRGWGPQTPDPTEEIRAVDIGLKWDGEDDNRHFVWRFDRRRHHH